MDDKLTKLLERKKALEFQRRQLLNVVTTKQRKANTRRTFVAGRVFLEALETYPEYKTLFYNLLDKFVTGSYDRALFNLAPLPNV